MTLSDFNDIPELPAMVGPAMQVAYVVPDIDAAMQYWHSEHSTGPFLIARDAVPLSNAYYRGEKAQTTRVHIAFAYIGDMQLELIELIGDTAGLYKEALDRSHQGVHHYAVLVKDFPACYNYLLDNGFTAVIDAGIDGLARMSYVENPEGLILEVIESNALTTPYFDGMRRLVDAADPGQLAQEFKLASLTPKAAVATQLVKFLGNKLTGKVQQTRRPG